MLHLCVAKCYSVSVCFLCRNVLETDVELQNQSRVGSELQSTKSYFTGVKHVPFSWQSFVFSEKLTLHMNVAFMKDNCMDSKTKF